MDRLGHVEVICVYRRRKEASQRALMAVREAIVPRAEGSIHRLQVHRVDRLVPVQFPRDNPRWVMDRGFLEQDEIDTLDQQEILQIIKERRLIFVRNNEGRITLVDCATVEEFRELLSLSLPRASTEPVQ
jgi:hypothetical protein